MNPNNYFYIMAMTYRTLTNILMVVIYGYYVKNYQVISMNTIYYNHKTLIYY